MKKTNKLFVIVHSESSYNKRGIFTGSFDAKLTPEGHEAAEKLSQLLKEERIDIAYTSPLSRAKQTLEHILAHHPETVVFEEKLIMERDYGVLAGKSKQKYKEEHPDLYPIYHRSYDIAPPGGESIKEVEARVLPFVKDVIKRIKKDHINVLIMSHSNAIRPILRYFNNLSIEEMMNLEHLRDKVYTFEIK